MSDPSSQKANVEGIARKGWDKDLADGLANEDRLEQCLRYGKIEVKRDYSASRTSNLYVEYWCRRKKSGLKATEAAYWAFTLGGEGEEYDLIVPTALLKKIVRYFALTGSTASGGDREGTAAVLVPLDAFNPVRAARDYHGFDPDKWTVPNASEEQMRQIRQDNLKWFEE